MIDAEKKRASNKRYLANHPEYLAKYLKGGERDRTEYYKQYYINHAQEKKLKYCLAGLSDPSNIKMPMLTPEQKARKDAYQMQYRLKNKEILKIKQKTRNEQNKLNNYY